MAEDPRQALTDLFRVAVAEADPMRVVATHLPKRPEGRTFVIGAGKASARMAEALEQAWGPCDGFVITRYGYGRPTRGIEIIEAAHPVPDRAGVDATRRMQSLLASFGPDNLVIALISGGGSALLCAPSPGLTLKDKIAVNQALLNSGAPIGEMNVVRKHLSAVKGGQLAAGCPAQMVALLISDVPGDDPAEIASGPTVGETSSRQDALEILDRRKFKLDDDVRAAIERSSVVAPNDPRLANKSHVVIAAPSKSLEAAATKARSKGWSVRMLGDALEGEARELASSQAKLALSIQTELSPGDPPVLLLSGGECTVTRRGDGVGGPNAEFTLAAALALDGRAGIHVLAGDTDGVDGAADIAGAYAGPETLEQARNLGLDAAQALLNNDAHGFFGRIDSQIVTGPTMTNVNDFRAILIEPT